LVLTNHHIVMDGWSLPILLREIFTSYYGQRLPAAVPYRIYEGKTADEMVIDMLSRAPVPETFGIDT